jgi:glycosyltransferase involved in cell wall biosynthesis
MKYNQLISVIMPTFNHELYIKEALRSIGNQTYKNIELIVINDGSTDRTDEIIKDYISNNSDKSIKYLSKQNEGVCKTLNIGLEMSTGDYVAFLASDDLWLPNRLAIQLEFMENNKNIGMVFTDTWFLNFHSKTNRRWSDYKPKIRTYFKNGIQNTDLYALLLTQPLIPALTVLIRRNVLLDVGFFEEDLGCEDYDLWLRIAMNYPIGYIHQPLAFYRIHGTNLSNDTNFMLRGMFKTVKKHLEMGSYKNKTMKKIKVISLLTLNLVLNRLKKRSLRFQNAVNNPV